MPVFQTSSYLPSKVNSGSQLYYTLLSPATLKATLLIVHGMQEHSGRYAEIAEYFASHIMKPNRF